MSKLLSTYLEEARFNPARAVRKTIVNIKRSLKKKKRNTKNFIKNTGDSIGDKTGAAIGRTAMSDPKTIETLDNVNKAAKTIKNVAIGAGAVGAAVVSAAAIQSGRKEYRNRILGQCAKYTGRDESICRIRAAKYHQSFLKSRVSQCSKSSDPTRCRERIEKAVQKAKMDEDKMVLKIR